MNGTSLPTLAHRPLREHACVHHIVSSLRSSHLDTPSVCYNSSPKTFFIPLRQSLSNRLVLFHVPRRLSLNRKLKVS